MKNPYLSLIILANFCFISTDPGVRLALDNKIISEIKPKFIKILNSKVQSFQNFNYSINLLKVLSYEIKLEIEDFNLQFSPIEENQLNLTFNQPNTIELKISELNFNASFCGDFKLWILNLPFGFDINVNKLNALANLNLTEILSQDNKGYLPDLIMQDFDLEIDFDFEFSGNFLFKFIDKIKSLFKNQIDKFLIAKLTNLIKLEFNSLIAEKLSKIPTKINIKDNITFDFSLTEKPEVKNDFVILSLKGLFENTDIPATTVKTVSQTVLPEYIPNAQSLQLFISEHTLNSLINTLYLSDLLHLYILPSEVPASSPIQLDLNGFDIFFPSISNHFPTNSTTRLKLQPTDSVPSLSNFNQGQFNLNFTLLMVFEVFQVKWIEIGVFSIEINLQLSVQLDENGVVNANINSISPNANSFLVVSSPIVPSTSFTDDLFISLALNYIPTVVNNKLNSLKIKLPIIDGFTISDSQAKIENEYVQFTLEPQINH